ncbi:hypothetical protein EEB18_018360 [Sphingopyxis sp. OPL5]|uniref:hypothetical protein n=1 Tax=Sphingopyxis sp. OPL5 TaxID=2486273 RepID=UPI00164D063C|nr:hypothetical protein [Sphingopyxis sp. OPL5]QNO26671.1 hypothetical protein EEB18_018360 [Sphingopyxis sp. OPL5]
MGTRGGKVAFALTPIIAFALFPLTMDLFLGPCFFEEGCGPDETLWVAGALLAALGFSVAPALAIRATVNRLSPSQPG